MVLNGNHKTVQMVVAALCSGRSRDEVDTTETSVGVVEQSVR